MPPPGVSIADEVRGVLTARAEALQRSLAAAAQAWIDHPERTRYLPDAEIFWKSADWALRHDEIYDVKQADWAREQLEEGERRLSELGRDEKPWLARTGLVVRGYRSRIDDSVQPFGMVVPPSFHPNLPHRWRLDCWFHGRGEKLTELDFIHQRMTSPGEFTPPDTLVLHPYGRYCNGSRFAGETDFFEALEVVKRDYRIDDDRIVVRGFSLGGAACWHLAAHHAAQWCAAAPGAGFSETEEFLTGFQGERLQPAPWERKLWALHDATAVAANFHNLPLVAYSGAKDRQKQAAEAMARALQAEGLKLTHIIGPDTGHSYEAAARAEIDRRIAVLAAVGRRDAPAEVLVTYTLRHHAARHFRLDGLDEHWTPARLTFWRRGGGQYEAHLTNISAFTIDLPPGQARRAPGEAGTLTLREIIDGRETRHTGLPLGDAASDGSLTASFHRHHGQWLAGRPPADGLRKKHGLQGPIDDAFMDRFLFVRPTGAPAHETPGAWARAEMDRALEQWRRQFRGDARIKDDTEVTDEDIRTSHLVLWGDPASNALLARVAPSLAIAWNTSAIQAGDRSFPAASHALIAIQPNPLNPEKYLVLNSGFTFREYDQLNNARQTPKLPDWAVIDLDTPPGSRHPGKIAAADFFGERWELKPAGP
jgi:pimeloyl-ACP methyl ester carboxylesterase